MYRLASYHINKGEHVYIDTIENDIVNDSYINEATYDICNKEDTKTIERLKKLNLRQKNMKLLLKMQNL